MQQTTYRVTGCYRWEVLALVCLWVGDGAIGQQKSEFAAGSQLGSISGVYSCLAVRTSLAMSARNRADYALQPASFIALPCLVMTSHLCRGESLGSTLRAGFAIRPYDSYCPKHS